MTPKEIATQYEAKVFESLDAARSAGFVLMDAVSPRNVWNKASATSAIVLDLVRRKAAGEVTEIGIVIEPWSVAGCFVPADAIMPAA